MVWRQLEQPKKLEHLATIKLAGWITLYAEKLMDPISNPGSCDAATNAEDSLSQQIEIIRNYFKYMPGILQNRLFTELMQQLSDLLDNFYPYIRWEDETDPFHQRYVPARMLEVLFTKNITSLTLNYEEIDKFGHSLAAQSSLLSGLTDLKLDINMLYIGRDDTAMETKITQLLKQLRSLKHLSIPGCTDNILRCIIENCSLIEELDLYNLFLCTDTTIDLLNQLHNLKNVNLHEPSLPLFREPAREYINSTKRRFLERIALRKQFNIKCYVNYGIPLDELQLIFKRYPLIQELTFVYTESNQTLLNYLEALSDLQNIRELIVYFYDFYEGHVKEILQVVGTKLHTLKLGFVENIDKNALKYIRLTCPHLQQLVIDHDGVKTNTAVHDLFPCNIDVPPFRNLRKFSLNIERTSMSIENPTDNFNEDFMIFLLSNCPNVEYIETCTYLSEDIMLQVLDKNPLFWLKELMLCFKLSKPVIDRIIDNCMSAEVVIYGEDP